MNTDCIFCRIAAGEIPTTFLYQDDEIVAFRDIHPEAPIHDLIVPRRHIPSLADLPDEETGLIGKMARVANKVARDEGISKNGYRIVINCGPDGGQVVRHLHMHLLGGRPLAIRLGRAARQSSAVQKD